MGSFIYQKQPGWSGLLESDYSGTAVITASGSAVVAGNRVTFTLPASGHTDLDGGVAIRVPARLMSGTLVGDLEDGYHHTLFASKRIWGPMSIQTTTAPTLGNGVHVYVALVYGDVSNTTTRRGMLAAIDFAATELVQAQRLNPTVANANSSAVAGVEGVIMGTGLVGQGYYFTAQGLTSSGGPTTAVAAGAYTGMSGGAVDDPWLVVGAWREGVTTGTEVVAVDVFSSFAALGAT